MRYIRDRTFDAHRVALADLCLTCSWSKALLPHYMVTFRFLRFENFQVHPRLELRPLAYLWQAPTSFS